MEQLEFDFPPLYKYDDGGRLAAGHKKSSHNTVCRSIAIATEIPYRTVNRDLNALAKKRGLTVGPTTSRSFIHWKVMKDYLEEIGWRWVPTMGIGQGCTMHLQPYELPPGRLIVRITGEYVAVINGRIHNTYECSRSGTRCVYGYFIEKN